MVGMSESYLHKRGSLLTDSGVTVKNELVFLCGTIVGEEIKATCFVAALEPTLGIRAILLPAVGLIALTSGAVIGFAVWPILRYLTRNRDALLYVTILSGLTASLTYLTVSTRLLPSFISPIISFVFGIWITCFLVTEKSQ